MPLSVDTSGAAGLAVAVADRVAAALAADGRPVDQHGLDLVQPAAPMGDSCSQVSVCVEAMARDDSYVPQRQGIKETGHWATHGGARWLVAYSVTILRCTPTDPNIGGLATATALLLGADLVLACNLLAQMHRKGEVFDPLDEFYFDGAIPVHNQGGTAGWYIQFRVPMDALPDLGL